MELRSARHTNNLKALNDFYTSILGFEILFSFEEHNGYSGVMLGKPGESWHLEFTQSDSQTEHQFDEEDLLIFYPSEQVEYNQILERIEANNIQKLTAKNPYWNENGVMVQDPDGFGVIICHNKIK